MTLSQEAPVSGSAGLGWPKSARWWGPLGWPATATVPRETSVSEPVAESTSLVDGPSDGVGVRDDSDDRGDVVAPDAPVAPEPPSSTPAQASHDLAGGQEPQPEGRSPGSGAESSDAVVTETPRVDAKNEAAPEHVIPTSDADLSITAGSSPAPFASGEPGPGQLGATDAATPHPLDNIEFEAESNEDERASALDVPRETDTDDSEPRRPESSTPSVDQPTATLTAPTTTETTPGHPSVTDAALSRPPGPRRARFDRDEFDHGDADTQESMSTTEASTPSLSRLPCPTRTRVFVVANQKGGVGKTTTSVNLAAGLALGGLNVVVIDLDPQGNASTALGIEHAPGTPGTYEVLIEDAAISDHLVASPEAPSLRVLPATIELAGAEIQLVSKVARENRLRKALRAFLADNQVDYVFLDCPPSLGLITLNALVAAGEILIPIQCEYYALEGVSQLVRTINVVKGELNEDLAVTTVLLTMYDARTRLAAQVADEVRAYFTEQTLPTVIPRSVRISEAPSYGQTVLTYHPDSAGAVSYLEAAHEIARRGAKENA